MQVNAVNSSSVNFGMRCPQRIKTRIMSGLTKDGAKSIFTHCSEAAESLDKIGSSSTTLDNFKIKRVIFDDIFDGDISFADVCLLKFKFSTPNCGSRKVAAVIRSVDNPQLNNLFDSLTDITQMAERQFIESYLSSQAKRGKLVSASKGLSLLYPNHAEVIADKTKQLELTDIIEKERRTHSIEQFIEAFNKF